MSEGENSDGPACPSFRPPNRVREEDAYVSKRSKYNLLGRVSFLVICCVNSFQFAVAKVFASPQRSSLCTKYDLEPLVYNRNEIRADPVGW